MEDRQVSLEYRIFVGLVGRNSLGMSVSDKDPEKIRYAVPVLFRIYDFAKGKYTWRARIYRSVADVFTELFVDRAW